MENQCISSERLDETASGVFVISATPFSEQGELDLESADRLVDFYIEKGVSGITILEGALESFIR